MLLSKDDNWPLMQILVDLCNKEEIVLTFAHRCTYYKWSSGDGTVYAWQ
jgi:hypothetical protein